MRTHIHMRIQPCVGMSGYMRQAAIREGRCRPDLQNSGAVLQGVTPCRGTHEGKGSEAARADNCVK